jgi:general stress protein 26
MVDSDAHTKLTELIKAAGTGMFSSINDLGNIVSRPMALQTVEFDGEMWFFTAKSSNKASEVRDNSQVNVSFLSGNTWVSVSGSAYLVEDRTKAKELWSPFVKAYFPGGLDDPELLLIKVNATNAEYWDGDNKLVSLFKIAKAAVTDTTPYLGENRRMAL